MRDFQLKPVIAATDRLRDVLFALVAVALLCFTFVLRYRLTSTLNVHWDEFNFLRHVHLGLRGENTGALQTFHIHLFGWLEAVDGTEVDQIIAARRFMFALSIVAAAFMAYIGHRLIGGAAGVFAAFCLGCHSYVMMHGTAFRYDGIIVTLFLGASAALLVERRRDVAASVAGACAALAVLISVKAAFYLPSLVLIACAPMLTGVPPRDIMRRLAILAGSATLVGGTLLLVHISLAAENVDAALQFASRAADQAVDLSKPFPRSNELISTLRWDAPLWGLWLLGVALLGATTTDDRKEACRRVCSLVALTMPLFTLYFYRNSWPYFYVSIMPGACLLAGVVWHRALSLRERAPVVAFVLVALITVPSARGAWLLYENNHDVNELTKQRDLLSAVHEIFAEPVPYTDRCGMVASFPKVGPFITSWSMGNYRKQGKDIMEELLLEEQPRMVLANVSALKLKRSRVRGSHALRHTDFKTLRENFVHHWGDVWVAGKRLDAPVGEATTFTLLIGGTYTLESPEPVEIDGATVPPNQALQLSVGDHQLRAIGESPVKIVLRTGDNLPVPERSPVQGDTFRGFKLRLPTKKWDFFDEP